MLMHWQHEHVLNLVQLSPDCFMGLKCFLLILQEVVLVGHSQQSSWHLVAHFLGSGWL